jgi:hypothetical protein
MAKQRLILGLLGILLPSSFLMAQVYQEQRTQHRFAQTYIGLNTQYVSSSGQLFFQSQSHAFPEVTIPRLTIGGMHFWGLLDFNMNLPLAHIGNAQLSTNGTADFSTGADLSARIYPFRVLEYKLRPFVGYSFNTMSLSLEDDRIGERIDGFITSSLLAGLSYSVDGWRINAEWMYLPGNKREFYSNRVDQHSFALPNHYFSLALVKHFDFTLSEEAKKLSGQTDALEGYLLKANKLNSLSFGIAANGSYFLQAPIFEGELASLPRHNGSINLEYSIGYLFHRQKLHVGLTYRTYDSNSISYGLQHVIRRQAFSLEGFKFLWDYNGFVPFFGLSLSYERWATGLFVNDVQRGSTSRSRIFSPGIIFGWDIVPTPVDTWVLRTNLRYYPYQTINDAEGRIRVDQFEFNFIQLVVYPNRWWNVRQAKKKIL